MTQATDTDIRELKTAIDGNTRAVDGLIKSTEANASARSDLTLEMRLGFGEVKGQITNLDTRISGIITNAESKLEGKINSLDTKFDERSKGMGQRLDGKELAQRNIFTGITVLIVGGILLAFFKYLFFGTLP